MKRWLSASVLCLPIRPLFLPPSLPSPKGSLKQCKPVFQATFPSIPLPLNLRQKPLKFLIVRVFVFAPPLRTRVEKRVLELRRYLVFQFGVKDNGVKVFIVVNNKEIVGRLGGKLRIGNRYFVGDVPADNPHQIKFPVAERLAFGVHNGCFAFGKRRRVCAAQPVCQHKIPQRGGNDVKLVVIRQKIKADGFVAFDANGYTLGHGMDGFAQINAAPRENKIGVRFFSD